MHMTSSLPLSLEQQAILKSCQNDPENPFWIQPMAVTVSGLFDESGITRAIEHFVNTSDIFHIRYIYRENGGFHGILDSDQSIDIDFQDLMGIDPDELAAEINWTILDEAEYVFDLENEPPVRVKILQIDEQQWIVLFLFHRIIYHRGVKPRYLKTFIDSLKKHSTSLTITDPESVPSYKEFATKRVPAITSIRHHDLVADSTLPVVSVREAGYIEQDLSIIHDSLLQLQNTRGLNLPDIFLTASLLWHYMFQRVASPHILAELPETVLETSMKPVAPVTWQTLIPSTIAFDETIEKLIKKIHQQWMGENVLTRHPYEFAEPSSDIFDDTDTGSIVCRFYDLTAFPQAVDDLCIEWSDTDINSTDHDLELIFKIRNNGSSLILIYNHKALSHEQAGSWVQEFAWVISRMIDQTDQPVTEFMRGLAIEQKKRQDPCHFPDPSPWHSRCLAESESCESLGELFSVIAGRFPENTAIQTSEGTISYRDLNELTNRIAGKLGDLTGQGGRIAILMDQGINVIAAILSVLKSGNSYVPMDITLPEQRLQEMLDDAAVSLVIVDNGCQGVRDFLSRTAVPSVEMTTLADTSDKQYAPVPVSGNQDAYIIYTSGSTGVPKGVLQSHRNVLHYVETYSRLLDITSQDTLTLMSAFLFDAAVLDIFSSLLNGATLVIFDLKKDDFSSVLRRIQEEQVTIYHSTASVFRYFSESLDPATCFEHIRFAVLGGEQSRKGDLMHFNRHFPPNATLANLYGLSELTIGTMAFFPHGTRVDTENLPIGSPIDAMDITLVNPDGIPTPGTGQMVVSSPYLAKQYWNRPDLTAEKFRTGLFQTSGLSFFTGDIGEITPDGSLRHLGRSDFQIKIRGYRVEPGEIESRLSECDGVSKSVVHPVFTSEGDVFLAAFIVSGPGASGGSMAELADILKRSLPDYMVPRLFVAVPELPKTPSGKINRRELEKMAKEKLAAR